MNTIDICKPVQFYNLLKDDINVSLFRYIQTCGISDIAEVLDGDPDLLNIGGTRVLFTEVETDDCKWIVYLNHDADITREQIENILFLFFTVHPARHFKLQECSWSNFQNLCIAYRGGTGYRYTIWKLKDDEKTNK